MEFNEKIKHKIKVRVVLILFAVFSASLIITNIYVRLNEREVNVHTTSNGRVWFAEEFSQLMAGDTILSVDGMPFLESPFGLSYPQLAKTKESFETLVLRDGEQVNITVPFDQTPTWRMFLLDSPLIIVAIFFWLSSVYVILFYVKLDWEIATLFLLFAHSMAILITSGISNERSAYRNIQISFTGLTALISFHFHIRLLFPKAQAKIKRLLPIVYFIGALNFIFLCYFFIKSYPIFLQSDTLARRESLFFEAGQTGIFLYILVFWGATIMGILWRAWVPTKDHETRKIYYVRIFGLIGFAPMFVLSFFPQLFGELVDANLPVFPYQLSMISLGVVPLGYSYVIRKHGLIQLDRWVSRTAVIFLTFVIMVGVYSFILGLSQIALSENMRNSLFVQLGTVLMLAFGFNWFRGRLQRWLDVQLYGGWYDFESVVNMVSAELDSTSQIAKTLNSRLQEAMRVKWSGLLMLDRSRAHLIPVSFAGDLDRANWFNQQRIANDSLVAHELFSLEKPIFGDNISDQLKNHHPLLEDGHLQMIAPIVGDGIHAILAIGGKYGGEPFGPADGAIVEVVTRQASLSLTNAELVDELEAQITENEQYQRQLINVREEEGKRIARELHDQLIQSLVGFKYQLADLQEGMDIHPSNVEMNMSATELQDQLVELIQTARDICHDLRSPTLDLGLIPSLRSVINKFTDTTKVEVDFYVGENVVNMPDEAIMVCLMRCLQEALKNVEKHAEATCVQIQLLQQQNQLSLTIQDNGKGFEVPKRLGSLMSDQHYGVIGMRERVELLGGRFQITSEKAGGAKIEICVGVG